MAKTCYIVSGSTGEYSDHSEWCVRVYTDKCAADAFALMANNWLRERGVHRENANAHYDVRDTILHNRPEFDEDLGIDYTGSDYVVIGPVPLNPKERK